MSFDFCMVYRVWSQTELNAWNRSDGKYLNIILLSINTAQRHHLGTTDSSTLARFLQETTHPAKKQ
jgi:hypothetical protein